MNSLKRANWAEKFTIDFTVIRAPLYRRLMFLNRVIDVSRENLVGFKVLNQCASVRSKRRKTKMERERKKKRENLKPTCIMQFKGMFAISYDSPLPKSISHP